MQTTFLKQAIFVLVAIFYLNFSFAQANGVRKKSIENGSNDHSSLNLNDRGTGLNGSVVNYKNGQDRYSFRLVQDKVTDLYVNDKKIPDDSIYLYKTEIDKIREQIKKDKLQADQDRKQAELDRKQADKDRAQAQIDKARAMEESKQAEKDREQARKDQARAELDRKQAEKDRQQWERDRAQFERDRQQAEKDRLQAEKDRQQAEKDRQQAVKDREQAEIDRKQAEEDRAMMKSLIAELVKEKVVNDGASVTSLKLNNDEFYVNDKKQSDELHKKFKAAFLKKTGSSISFRNTNGFHLSTTTSEKL